MVLGKFAGDFGKSFVSMAWEDEGLRNGLNTGSKKVQDELQALMEYHAPEIENWMKNNAPWQDQTGNARNGLAARAYKDSSSTGIVLYHQVPYGIWLEVRNSGRYAIIVPAMEEWGQRVMQSVRDMLNRM